MTSTTPSVPNGGDTDLDEMLEAFKTHERRAVLRYLVSTDSSSVPVRELVDEVQSCLETRSYREVKALLHHHHLPRLEAAGLITHDNETQQVVYHGHPLVPELIQDAPPA